MQNNTYTDVKPINPTCGNGIDEVVFENVVASLNNQNCDKRGPDYMLYDDGDFRELARDPYNKVRYDLVEGFSHNGSSNIWCYWLLVILFLVLLYFVLFN